MIKARTAVKAMAKATYERLAKENPHFRGQVLR